VKDPEQTPVRWWNTTPALSVKGKEFKFTPGINLVCGPVGSGKSTLLVALAKWFHAEQSGSSCITTHSIGELFGPSVLANKIQTGLEFKHDGQPISYVNSTATPGLIANGAAFDDDFGNLIGFGIQHQRLSEGQKVLMNLNRILDAEPSKIASKFHKGTTNDYWLERLAKAEKVLAANAEVGQRTLILDEPDRSFDLVNQMFYWHLLLKADWQIIVSSHSIWSYLVPVSSVIETLPGYYGFNQNILYSMFGNFQLSVEQFADVGATIQRFQKENTPVQPQAVAKKKKK
jgi:predicted ATPase